MSAQLTEPQYRYLTQGIAPGRVRVLSGKGSHLEAWDVRRTLIRVFGFGGYDIEDMGTHLVREIEYPAGTIQYGSSGKTNNRTVWTVVYRVNLRLIVKDAAGREIAHFDDCATGDAIHQPSLGDAHDLAVKTAHSQALKRCAVNLGDQFGLSLYNQGSKDAVVVGCAISPLAQQPAPTADDAPDVLGGEMDAPTEHDGTDDYAPPVGQGTQARAQAPARPTRKDQDDRDAAVLLAKAASRSGDRTRLLGILSQAKTKNILGVRVDDVISPAEAAVAGLGEPPVTLETWITACGKYTNTNGGMPVWNAAHPEEVKA